MQINERKILTISIFRRKKMEVLKRFWRDQRGLETVEWAVIAALIVGGLVGIIALLGGNVKTMFERLQSATTPP